MADTKISALTAGTAAGTDRFPVAISPFGSGDNRYLTPDLLGTYFANSTWAAGTVTASSPFQITKTWNNAGVTFTLFKVNVTDSASAAASLLMDLQKGSTSQWSVTKDGATIQLGFAAIGHTSQLTFNSLATNLQVLAGPLQFNRL
jgi:hypothetical protein